MELIISIILGMMLMEAYAWIPKISNWLLDRAVRKIHADEQQRCREEWSADLNAIPDGMVKLWFAIRNFSSGVAETINADFLDTQAHDMNEVFEDLVKTHHALRASFGRLKLAHAESITQRVTTKRRYEENLLSLRSREWPNGKPKSVCEIQTLLENLGSKVLEPSGLISELLGKSIDTTYNKIERVDCLFKSASTNRDKFFELLANRDYSHATHERLDSITKDLSGALAILKDAAEIDELLKKRKRIRAKVDRERYKIQNALSKISK